MTPANLHRHVRAYELNALIKHAAAFVLSRSPDDRDDLAAQFSDRILVMLKQQDSVLGRKIAPKARSLPEYLAAQRLWRAGRNWESALEPVHVSRNRKRERKESVLWKARQRNAAAKAPVKQKKLRRRGEEAAEWLAGKGKRAWAKRKAAKIAAYESAIEKARELLSIVCGEIGVLECHVCDRLARLPREITLARRVFAVIAMDTKYLGARVRYIHLGEIAGGKSIKSMYLWHTEGRTDSGAVLVASAICDRLGIEPPAYARKAGAA